MGNNVKKSKKKKAPCFEINNQQKRVNFTLESQNTKPYNIEKMTGKKSGQNNDKKE